MSRSLTFEEIEAHEEAGENFHVPARPALVTGARCQVNFCGICDAPIASEDGGKTWEAI